MCGGGLSSSGEELEREAGGQGGSITIPTGQKNLGSREPFPIARRTGKLGRVGRDSKPLNVRGFRARKFGKKTREPGWGALPQKKRDVKTSSERGGARRR